MEKHFVDFYSPGSFVSEATRREVAAWDVDEAVRISAEINERHGARPYGFRFVTRSRAADDLDAKDTAHSGMYYLGGCVETRQEVDARNDPKEEILRSNMRINDIERIVVNDNSWRFTAELRDGDVVLPPPTWAIRA